MSITGIPPFQLAPSHQLASKRFFLFAYERSAKLILWSAQPIFMTYFPKKQVFSFLLDTNDIKLTYEQLDYINEMFCQKLVAWLQHTYMCVHLILKQTKKRKTLSAKFQFIYPASTHILPGEGSINAKWKLIYIMV